MDETDRAIDRGADAEARAHDELQCYTLAHRSSDFIHQHVVDAWVAQHADERTKPMTLAFALIGLCLRVDRGVSGRRVHEVHMILGRQKRDWPELGLPESRGAVTVLDVMAAPAGPKRDRAIDDWCESVWAAFGEHRQTVADLIANARG